MRQHIPTLLEHLQAIWLNHKRRRLCFSEALVSHFQDAAIPHSFYNRCEVLLAGRHMLVQNAMTQFLTVFDERVHGKELEHAITPIVAMQVVSILNIVLTVCIAFDGNIEEQFYIITPTMESTFRNRIRFVIIHGCTRPFIIYSGAGDWSACNSVYKPDVTLKKIRC